MPRRKQSLFKFCNSVHSVSDLGRCYCLLRGLNGRKKHVRKFGIACPNYYVLTVQLYTSEKNNYFKENAAYPNYMRVGTI